MATPMEDVAPPPPPTAKEAAAAAEEDEGERMCRYCFDGEEEGELISPCGCRGGQKWVHLDCLRRWQRMVLVSQPTHPMFHNDDLRQQTCNVCKQPYTCAPPTRHELMRSFTGVEIASLVDVGCVIGAGDEFSRELEEQLQSMPRGLRRVSSCVRRADISPTNRGGAAAGTRIVRGDESRRRRGGDVDVAW